MRERESNLDEVTRWWESASAQERFAKATAISAGCPAGALVILARKDSNLQDSNLKLTAILPATVC
jgi:hypothetical protein